MERFFRLLQFPLQKRWFLWALLVINILGSAYGFYWYRFQLAETPWYYLIFVPDSPLSSSLFCVALTLILARKPNSLIQLWAYLWAIKYGIWAVIINGDVAYSYTAMFSRENLMLALSHAGMALEGFIFLRHLNFNVRQLGIVAAWLFINDFVDYVLNQHPFLFAPSQLALAQAAAVTLSLGLIIIARYFLQRQNMLA
ncbi:MAG: DUF1405 domain-containing protein [Peptococcaceae bacterium]|nr:DUF1405 domain-containing protein [Peptococcaceae bacterium]